MSKHTPDRSTGFSEVHRQINIDQVRALLSELAVGPEHERELNDRLNRMICVYTTGTYSETIKAKWSK